MNAQFTIGVVVPVLNGVRYIEETLRAISGQTLPPDRLVVVDNGSTDGTLQLLERLASELSLDILRESAPGAAAARDTGVQALFDCDLVAFCDSDDIWHPDKLEKQARLFREDIDGSLVCVYCANLIIDEEGSEIARSARPTLRGYVHPAVAQGHPILGSMSAILVRRHALLEAGGFDRSLLADEDLDLFIRLSLQGRFDFVPEQLADLRTHSLQTSRQAERLLRSKGQIVNKYPQLYAPGSIFLESVRIEHMRLDLQGYSGVARILRSMLFPLVFRQQVRRSTSGRAQILLFPGLLGYGLWLLGRICIHTSNRLSRRALGAQ